MIYYPQEFTINLRYRPYSRHDQVKTPGFYLTAGWGNEGQADYPIDTQRLTPEQVRKLCAAVDELGLARRGRFTDAAEAMRRDMDRTQEQRLEALKAARDKAQREIDLLEGQA